MAFEPSTRRQRLNLRWLLLVLVWITGAVVILWLAGARELSSVTAQVASDAVEVEPRQLDLSQFKLIVGDGTVSEEAIAIDQVAADGSLLAVQTITLSAADYPVLEYQLGNPPGSHDVLLVWRRSDGADVYQRPLYIVDGGATLLLNHPEWRGDIIELGLAVFPVAQLTPASTPIEPFTVDGLSLRTMAPSDGLASLWSQWRAFNPWTLRSINHLGGQPGYLTGIRLSMLLAVWAVFAALSGWILMPDRRRRLLAMGTAFGIAWLLLDLRFVDRLLTQQQTSQHIFARDGQMVDAEPELQRVATQIAAHLPEQADGSRLFIQAPSTFVALKVNYYLIPQPALPWLPGQTRGNPRALRAGDLVAVVMDPEFQAQAERGYWSGRKTVVELIRVANWDNGALYRITEVSGGE